MPKLNLNDVAMRIEVIKAKTHDNEVAHSMEDQLHRDVLNAIALGAKGAREMARLALTTCDLKFARWMA